VVWSDSARGTLAAIARRVKSERGVCGKARYQDSDSPRENARAFALSVRAWRRLVPVAT
jgi:hypothetical protein